MKDIEEVLLLNKDSSELVERRKAVYKSCKKELEKLLREKPLNAVIIAVKKKVEHLQKSDNYPEYAGVMLFYFVRWLNYHDIKMDMY